MHNVTIRAATVADAHAIAVVHTRAWQWAYRGLMPDDLLDGLDVVAREASWTQRLSTKAANAEVWLAESSSATVGFVAAGPARDEDQPSGVGEVYAIYLDHAAIGQGIGRLLLEQAVLGLSERGFQTAMLWVLTSNARARRFYENAGFRIDGAEKHEQRGNYDISEVRYSINLRTR
jgi:ribosomal protein S18 acetylase RimI-like enzyme